MIRSIPNVSVLLKARRSGLALEAILFVVIVVVLLCGVSAFSLIRLVKPWVLQSNSNPTT
jgi:hypothetical protein